MRPTAGAGGFINISQSAKNVVFVGTFNAGRLDLAIEDSKLQIREEGASRKFLSEVEHRTFSGKYAAARKQTALYITERCVFSLCEKGLELVEIAPGVDLARDILAQMDFTPIMRQPPSQRCLLRQSAMPLFDTCSGSAYRRAILPARQRPPRH